MYWNNVKKYIEELVVFMLICLIFVVFLLNGGIVVVTWPVLFILLLIVLFIWLIQYLFSFVPFAAKVIMDLLLHQFDTELVTFVEQMPFRSSSFSDRNVRYGKEVIRKETLYFKVIGICNNRIDVFTTYQYYHLESGKWYLFTFGHRSHALVEVEEKKNE